MCITPLWSQPEIACVTFRRTLCCAVMILPPHHEAWLSVHPHRSRRWFLAKLKEGFDVHHLDGNHGNNTPSNLALVEHTDHMMVHNGGTHFLGRLKRKSKLKKPAQIEARPAESEREPFGFTVPPLFAVAGFHIEALGRGCELINGWRRGRANVPRLSGKGR